MIKKNPSYRVTIYPAKITGLEPFIIEYPITCRFNSQRGTFSQANKCTIELYNLAEGTRNAIFKDALVGDLEEKNWKFIKLEAGWNGELATVFYGRILQAYSTKGGSQTDVITRIECLPFDIFNSQSSCTFAEGTGYREAYKTMAADMPNTQIGNLGRLDGTFKTQTTFDGNTLNNLNKLTGGNTYVDNGVLNTLMSNEVIDVPVPLVTASNELLETPIRRNATLTIKMLFEPTLIVGQLLSIQSRIQKVYDGQYRVLAFNHDCLISPTQAGHRITTVDLWAIPALIESDINLTNEQITGGTASVTTYKVNGETIMPINEEDATGIYAVYRYLQKNNGQIPNTKITANISWKEMLGNNNTNAERKSECTIAVLTNVYNTAQQLQKIHDTYWKGRPLYISSGWRSVRNNKSCGGAPKSRHLWGQAVDFNLGQATIKSDYAIMKKYWQGFILYEGTWIHADIRGWKGYANDK